jgi:hypothetical protein
MTDWEGKPWSYLLQSPFLPLPSAFLLFQVYNDIVLHVRHCSQNGGTWSFPSVIAAMLHAMVFWALCCRVTHITMTNTNFISRQSFESQQTRLLYAKGAGYTSDFVLRFHVCCKSQMQFAVSAIWCASRITLYLQLVQQIAHQIACATPNRSCNTKSHLRHQIASAIWLAIWCRCDLVSAVLLLVRAREFK